MYLKFSTVTYYKITQRTHLLKALDLKNPDVRPPASAFVKILDELTKKRVVKKGSEKPGTSKLKLPEKQSEKASTSREEASIVISEKNKMAQREVSEGNLEKEKAVKKKQERAPTSIDKCSGEELDKSSTFFQNKSVVWTKNTCSRKWFPKKGK